MAERGGRRSLSKLLGLDPWLHWGLFSAVVLLPVLLSLVTAQVAFERSKTLEFCSSCHVMGPFVAGLKDPESEGLAAKHYQFRRINHNQCYTCHSDYDFLGPVKAKVTGMRHLAHYYLSAPRPPKLYKPYRNGACLSCHEGAKSFERAATHEGLMEQIKAGEMSCLDCHGPAHPAAGSGS